MVSKKALTVINIGLGLIAVLLLLNFLGVNMPTLGKAMYALDDSEPLCAVHNWENELRLWNDLDQCCLEAKKQPSCNRETSHFGWERMDWVCPTGSKIKYRMNNKAYNYCKQQSFW